jgi:hypothetical protein
MPQFNSCLAQKISLRDSIIKACVGPEGNTHPCETGCWPASLPWRSPRHSKPVWRLGEDGKRKRLHLHSSFLLERTQNLSTATERSITGNANDTGLSDWLRLVRPYSRIASPHGAQPGYVGGRHVRGKIMKYKAICAKFWSHLSNWRYGELEAVLL